MGIMYAFSHGNVLPLTDTMGIMYAFSHGNVLPLTVLKLVRNTSLENTYVEKLLSLIDRYMLS